jgi:hypothetical protein
MSFEAWHHKLFFYGLYLSYFLYAVIILGLSKNAPGYLTYVQNGLKLYVSIFLILRFNPFVRNTFTKFDQNIVFQSAVFLLTTTAITEYVIRRVKQTSLVSSFFSAV